MAKKIKYGTFKNNYSVNYTNGKEFLDSNNNEYIGFYVTEPGNKFYEGSKTISHGSLKKPLRRIPEYAFNPENKKYFELTDLRFDKHTGVTTNYVQPSKRDYKQGYFTRYFVKKINEDAIYELDVDRYESINIINRVGPNERLYDRLELRWTIAGPIDQAKLANERMLLSKEEFLPGLSKFLGDLDEFHETKPIVQRQTLDREYPDGEKMHPNLPAAYGFSNQKNQACSNCIFKNNNACKLWQANIRNNYWCGRWKAIPDTTY